MKNYYLVLVGLLFFSSSIYCQTKLSDKHVSKSKSIKLSDKKNRITKNKLVDVSGVVTYYFNEYQGDKPDIGAKIYITKKNIDTLMLGLFCARTERLITTIKRDKNNNLNDVEYYNELANIERDKSIESLQASINRITDEYKMNKDSLLNEAWFLYRRISDDENTFSTTVDAVGRYQLKVTPGKYNIIVISKGRQDLNFLELRGKMIIETLEVKDKIETNKDFRFDL